jgi:hypothetical protein
MLESKYANGEKMPGHPVAGNCRGTLQRGMEMEVKITPVG